MPPAKAANSNKSDKRYRDQDQEMEVPGYAHKPLLAAQLELFLKSDKTDCKIVCQGHEWQVHEVIVCPRSKYFKKMFNGDFMESGTKVLKWEDKDPHAVEGLLLYLYTMSYPSWHYYGTLGYLPEPANTTSKLPSDNPGETSEFAPQAVDEEKIEHKTSIVKALPNSKLKTVPSGATWRTALGLFKIAEKCGVANLRKLAAFRLSKALKEDVGSKGHVHLLEEVWALEGEGSDELNNEVVEVICGNLGQLLDDPDFVPVLQKHGVLCHNAFATLNDEITSYRPNAATRRK